MYKKTARIKSIRELIRFIREDYRVNDKDLTRPGFQAVAIYRFGVWVDSIRPSYIRMPLYFGYKILHVFVRNFYGIEIYASANFGRRLRIAHQGVIVVHLHSSIGDDCLIRQGVSIGRGPNHGGGDNNLAPVLGNRVEVGANAVIVGGITIGDNVIIGPNAVVMTNVKSNSMVLSPQPKILPMMRNPIREHSLSKRSKWYANQ